MQVIPARHGVATFVPAGQTIKIVNTSGSQVIDTWAFALPKPEGKKGEVKEDEKKPAEKKEDDSGKKDDDSKKQAPKSTPAKKKKDGDLPSQEDAEKATQGGMKQGEEAGKDAKKEAASSGGWSSYVPTSYVPSLGFSSTPKKGETETQKDSRTWASYFPSGVGFGNYIPKTATDTVSAFAAEVSRSTKQSHRMALMKCNVSTNATPRNPTSSNCKTSPKPPSAPQVTQVPLPHSPKPYTDTRFGLLQAWQPRPAPATQAASTPATRPTTPSTPPTRRRWSL